MKNITGAASCDEIIAGLKELGLDLSNCRSQCFDGAGIMAGVQNGCAAKLHPERLTFTVPAMHDLNLVLCKAGKVPPIVCLLETLNTLGVSSNIPPNNKGGLNK